MGKKPYDKNYQKWLEEKLIREATKRAQQVPSGAYSQRDNVHQVLIGKDKGWLQFGLMGDLHLCSKFSNEKGIAEYFARMRDRGVKHIFSAGDNIDGMFVYRTQIGDLKVLGSDAQNDYVANFINKELPDGIMMHIITGNHEEKAWEKLGVDAARNLAQTIPKKVQSLNNKQGCNMYATVFIRPMLTLDLLHGLRYCGERSAPEYTLMKTVDGYKIYNQPDILGIGHTHRIARSNYRDCHSYLVGGFEYPNNFIARSRAGEDHGGWIIEVHTDDDKRIDEMRESFIKVKS